MFYYTTPSHIKSMVAYIKFGCRIGTILSNDNPFIDICKWNQANNHEAYLGTSMQRACM